MQVLMDEIFLLLITVIGCCLRFKCTENYPGIEISPLKMGRKIETGHWKWLVIRQSCNAFFYQLIPFCGMALT